jgi:hypothetical protein
MSKRAWYWSLGIAVALGIAGLFTWWALPASDDGADAAASASLASSGIAASGALETNAANTRKPVMFRLTLANTTDNDVAGIRVTHVGTDKIALTRADWCRAGTTRTALATDPACAMSLAPRQSITVSGVVEASKSTRDNITATVEWSEGRPIVVGNTTATRWTWSRAVVPLGALTAAPQWARLMGAVFASMPTWLLPLILAGLGFGFQKHLSDLQSDRESHEKESAAKSEAWRTMLPVSHNYAIQFYAPLIGAADHFTHNARAALQAAAEGRSDQAAVNGAFYGWLMLYVRKNSLVNSAYYFKNHIGEQVVAGLIGAHARVFLAENTAGVASTATQQSARRLVDRAVAAVNPDEKKYQVLERVAYERALGGGPLTELMAWFEGRLTRPGMDDAVSYLEAYSLVLSFEMNRPYAQWFEEPARLSARPEHIATIRKMVAVIGPSDPEIADIATELDGYLKKAGVRL